MPSKISTQLITATQTVSGPLRVIDFIQSDQYASKLDPSVNKIMSRMFRGYSSGVPTDPMTVVNYAETTGAGGLVSRSYDLTPAAVPMWFGMDFHLVYLAPDWATIMRMELDDKVMVADGTKQLDASGNPTLAAQMNESHQWNPDTNSWQYDPDGNGWQDIGFTPKTSMLLSDPAAGHVQVNDVRFRWSWNGVVGDQGRWSSLAMAQNGEMFTNFGPKFVNIPLIKAKWGGPLRHVQVQTEYRGAVPGSHAFQVVRGRLLDSTLPIDINLPWA